MKHAIHHRMRPRFLTGAFFALLAALPLQAAVDTKSLETELRKAAKFENIDDRAPLDKIEKIVAAAAGNAADSAAVEKRLLIILKGAKTTSDCREFLCSQLRLVGSSASVPTLAKMASLERYSEMALNGLGGIKHVSATTALHKLFANKKAPNRAGIIKAMGEQGDPKSATLLAPLADGDDEELAVVAVTALGGITSPASLKAIKTAIANGDDEVKTAGAEALMTLGKSYAAAKNKASAAKAYGEVYEIASAPAEIRSAALAGLVETAPDQALQYVAKDLTGSDEAAFTAALEYVKSIPGDAATRAFSEALANAPAARKSKLFAVVAGRGGAGILPAIKQALEGSDPAMKSAAVSAAASVSSPDLIGPLLVIARGVDPTAISAREALVKMEGDTIDATLATHLDKAAVYPVLAARKASKVLPQVYAALDEPAFAHRNPATELIGDLAPGSDLGKVVNLMVAGNKLGDSRSVANAMQKITARVEDPAERDAPFLAALSKTTSSKLKATIMESLARGGSKEALKLIRKDLKSPASVTRGVAVKALAAWPNGDANADLLEIARTSKNSDQRRMAHRAYLEKAVSVKELEAAGDLKARTAEKRIMVANLATMKDPAALNYTISLLKSRDIQVDAARAILTIGESADASQKADLLAALTKIIESVSDRSVVEKAKALKEKMSK